MTATAADERSPLPGPTWPPSAPPPSFPLGDRRPVVLADDPCEAGFSGAGPEYAGIYLHARYFDPKLGIFLSPDPIGVAGGMNLYGYGFGDPVNGSDRSGLLLDQCFEDPECKIRVYGPGVDGGPASNPGGPGFSFSASSKAAVGGAGGGLLLLLIDKLAGPIGRFFGGHSNNAPWDPSVPPATAYVPGKHIDPYSDYEEPGLDSLVSLVPTGGT